MSRPTAGMSRATLAFAFTLSAIGCGQSDLSGYRPAKEHSAVPVAVPDEPNSTTSSELAKSQEVDADQNVTASALVPVNVVDGGNVRALMSIPAIDPRTDDSAGIQLTTRSADPGSNPLNSTEASTAPKKIELLVKEKTFRGEAKTGALRVSFDDFDLLKVLNMDPVVADAVDYMPQWLTNLNGKSVKLRGYMFPTHDAEGIEQFVLARDNQICCFGRYPKIYDLVQITMKAGKTTNYIPSIRAFDVIGKFRIEMHAEGGEPCNLFFIDDALVIDR